MPHPSHPRGDAGAAPCPCGSRARLDACCGPILAGTPAVTAEQLMRSRFSANALGDAAHLLRTWQPSTRPSPAELEDSLAQGLSWTRLVIHDVERGGAEDTEGTVDFTAIARDEAGAKVRLRERSRFARAEPEAGSPWLYLDGEVEAG